MIGDLNELELRTRSIKKASVAKKAHAKKGLMRGCLQCFSNCKKRLCPSGESMIRVFLILLVTAALLGLLIKGDKYLKKMNYK